jgi:hypothetical protein
VPGIQVRRVPDNQGIIRINLLAAVDPSPWHAGHAAPVGHDWLVDHANDIKVFREVAARDLRGR